MKKFLPLFFVALATALSLVTPSSANENRGLRIAFTDQSGQSVGGYKNSYALLIGVSDYTAGWPDLESIPSEIAQVEALLALQGFVVEKVLNPDTRKLRAAFEDFIGRYGYDKENRLLFYYAGHGFTREEGSKGYLVPADSPNPDRDEVGFLRTALDMNRILSWSREMEAKHALFLFDSCFSGTIFKQRDLPRQPAHISRLTAEPVRQFITAGSAGEPVPAASVFTPAFIDALKYGTGDLNGDGYVSGTELGLYLQEKVPQHTAQTPQYGKINDYKLSRGDFIFLAKAAPASAPSAEPAAVLAGKLRVVTQPAGATIYIDNVQRGVSPLSVEGLPERVTVRAVKPGYKAVEERVRLRSGRVQEVPMTLVAEPVYGELEVKSNPPGAKWYLDGDYMGTTPDRATQIRPGTHVVRIEKAGFDAQEYRQNIVTGPNATLAASLRPAASVAVAVPAAPPPVAYSPTTPVDARDVINKLSSGIQRYLSSDLSLKAPDVAENGAVVPLEGLVYSNLPGSMFIFVDNGGQMVFAGSLEFKVPVSRYFFSTRVRMPNSGDLTVAFVDAAGNIKAANKRIKVTIGGKLESGGGVALPGGDKSIRMRESGGTVKMLVASPVTVNAHVESFRVEGDGRLLAVGGFTPWLSKNPYFSFPIPNGVGQLNIGMVGNDRSTANVAVRTTVANR